MSPEFVTQHSVREFNLLVPVHIDSEADSLLKNVVRGYVETERIRQHFVRVGLWC